MNIPKYASIAALAVTSGDKIASVNHPLPLSLQLLKSIGPTANRCCAIAIANNTDFRLIHPKVYTSSGSVLPYPELIEAGMIGFIGTVNTHNTVCGTVGVITFEIENFASENNHLQILWSVPYDQRLFHCKVNIRVGEESASADLYHQMYHDEYKDTLTDAMETGSFFLLNKMFAEVFMTVGPRSGLSITLLKF